MRSRVNEASDCSNWRADLLRQCKFHCPMWRQDVICSQEGASLVCKMKAFTPGFLCKSVQNMDNIVHIPVTVESLLDKLIV